MRSVPKMKMLAEPEVTDLFKTVRLVYKMVEDYYGVSATTITIQDTKTASQSIRVSRFDSGLAIPVLTMVSFQHVHVHIIPRIADDMSTRDLYAKVSDPVLLDRYLSISMDHLDL